MLQTLAITAPIYSILALGYVATRLGYFSPAVIRGIAEFVVKVPLPALVFAGLSQRPLQESLDGAFLLAYGGGSLAVLTLAVVWTAAVQKKSLTLGALRGLGMSASNSGFIGYAVGSMAIGPGPAAVVLAMCIVVEAAIMIPTALVLADAGEAAGARPWPEVVGLALLQQARNPLVLAMVAGMAVALSGVTLPEPVMRPVSMLAAASAPVSLFAIGGTLVGLSLGSSALEISAIAFGKLLLHPLAVGLLAFLLIPEGSILRGGAVVFAAAPMIGILPLLAQKYGLQTLTAAALLVAITASFATMTSVIWLLDHVLHWI